MTLHELSPTADLLKLPRQYVLHRMYALISFPILNNQHPQPILG